MSSNFLLLAVLQLKWASSFSWFSFVLSFVSSRFLSALRCLSRKDAYRLRRVGLSLLCVCAFTKLSEDIVGLALPALLLCQDRKRGRDWRPRTQGVVTSMPHSHCIHTNTLNNKALKEIKEKVKKDWDTPLWLSDITTGQNILTVTTFGIHV